MRRDSTTSLLSLGLFVWTVALSGCSLGLDFDSVKACRAGEVLTEDNECACPGELAWLVEAEECGCASPFVPDETGTAIAEWYTTL